MSAPPVRKAYEHRRPDAPPWAERVAVATVHDTGRQSLVTYANVRILWLRRTVAALQVRTVLSALCSAASPAPPRGRDR